MKTDDSKEYEIGSREDAQKGNGWVVRWKQQTKHVYRRVTGW